MPNFFERVRNFFPGDREAPAQQPETRSFWSRLLPGAGRRERKRELERARAEAEESIQRVRERIRQIEKQAVQCSATDVEYALNEWKDELNREGDLLGDVDEHPNTAQSQWWLATQAQQQGKYLEAKGLYEQAMRVYEQQLGTEHPTTQAIRNNYAALLEKMGQG